MELKEETAIVHRRGQTRCFPDEARADSQEQMSRATYSLKDLIHNLQRNQ